jgi:uncharacterized protein (TIGR03085 family)
LAPALAATERASLCDLFDELGPHAPTLCGGWDCHHLAAHLSLREGNSLTLVKLVATSAIDTAVDELAAQSDFGDLVSGLRRGPSPMSIFSLPKMDRVTGTLEFFVHHEDVRRAAPRWTVRELPRRAQDEIWSKLRRFSKVLTRHSPVGLDLLRSDTEETARAAKGPDTVVISALPSELALFAYGRVGAARVDLDGSPAAVAALSSARLGI